ncbi:MAG: hypothetical protein DRR04_10415 [Gammaproteobacteria bacterium]|nr:MAG: hypothetical protein DRR04_10415 [Gammaproteobacteria bacterium]
MKQFIYKVYDATDNFIETIDDVASTPHISTEINSAGSELVLKLARAPDDYDEGGSIEFGNTVKIYVKASDAVEPELFFQGKITSYTPKYKANEGVEITLYSLGAELDLHVYKALESSEQDSSSGSQLVGIGTGHSIEQSFIPDQPTLTSIDLKLYVDATTNVTLGIHTDASGSPSGSAVTNGTIIKEISASTSTVTNFAFSSPPILTTGNTYWMVITGGLV